MIATGQRAPLPGEGARFVVEEHTSREDWLTARGIGGASAVSLWAHEIAERGGSTFGSPYSVWCALRGLVPDGIDGGTEPDWIRIGRRMEPVIADEYAEREGVRLVYPGPFTVLRSLAYPWLTVSLDRVILLPDADEDPGVLECKNRSVAAATDWNEGLPLSVQVQIAHAQLVTGWTWGAGAAIIGGNQFRAYRYERDPAFLDAHLDACRDLWARVESGDPPAVDGHAATTRALKAIYARDSGETIEAPAELAAWAFQLESHRRDLRGMEESGEFMENRIRAALGDVTAAVLPDGRRLQAKAQVTAPSLCECGREKRKGSTSRPIRFVKGQRP